MTVEFKFEIGQAVLVSEIQRPGRVTALRLDSFGRQALVVVWNDGNRHEHWLYEWECEERKETLK